LVAGLALYSGVGSTVLVVLAVTLPERRPVFVRSRRRSAFA
jgi:hypothetical protein